LLAERSGRGALHAAPAARRVRRLGQRAQGRARSIILGPDDAGVRLVCAAARYWTLPLRRRRVRAGAGGEAAAGHAALRLAPARLLATAASNCSARLEEAGAREAAAVRARRGRERVDASRATCRRRKRGALLRAQAARAAAAPGRARLPRLHRQDDLARA